MHKNWTISCHNCGGNHAHLVRAGAEILVSCPAKDCGMKEDVATIVAERD
jgi:hypothetical protein